MIMKDLTEATHEPRLVNEENDKESANHDPIEQNQLQFVIVPLVIKSTRGLFLAQLGTGTRFNNGDINMDLCNLASTERVRSFVNEESPARIPQKLRVWLLGNHTADDRFVNSIRKRLENTCDWIFKNEKFVHWRSETSSSPNFLWIYGPPGFGKTVLCARIIEHIKNENEDVAYYFFSTALESYKDPMVAMRSWMCHLVTINESVFDIVNKKLEHGVAALQNVIIELFQEAIKLVRNCTLVIDGLDECTPSNSCLSVAHFFSVINNAIHGTNCRILIMSRYKPDIRQALEKAKSIEFSEHGVWKNDVRSDIEALSKSIVAEKLQVKDAAIQDEMVKKMSDQSGGQFLWLKLLQDSLREGMTQEQFQDALAAASANLWDVYSRNWHKFSKENDRSRVVSLLRLAVFSFRPLTVREISEAILVSDKHKDFPIHELPDKWDVKYVKEKILDLCCCFLETRKQSSESPIEEWTIHLVHDSFKEFLLKRILHPDSTLARDEEYLSMIETEHIFVAKLCITYMNYSYAWQNSKGDGAPSSGSFTNYAAKFWNKHATARMTQQNIWIEEFFAGNSFSWDMWRKWFDSSNDDWNSVKGDQATPLCYAIELGFVDLASAIMNKGEVRVNCNSGNRTALGVACSKGYEVLVRELLTYGAKVGARDAHGRTAVYYAAMNGHLKLVELLIDKGADIKIRDYNGVSPFLAASTNGHLNTMRRLIQKGADIHQLDRNGNSALSKAISNDHIEAVRLLLGKSAHSKLPGYLTIPPANEVLRSGSFHLVRLLIDHESDLNTINKTDKQTILHLASLWGSTDIVKLLVDRKADLTLQDLWGQTPLFLACAKGYVEIAKFLLQHGADHNVVTHNGQTPLFVACSNGHLKMVELLLKHDANHSIAITKTGQTPLIAACCNGHIEVVKLLVENKADILKPDKQNKTPLYGACANGHLEVASLLIDKGADITTSDKFGNTILSAAAFGGSYKIVRKVFRQGADVSTAVLVASERGHIRIVELFIKFNGEDALKPSIIDESLIHASSNGHIDVVSLLLENGADPNTFGPRGQTPLYGACCGGHIEVARLLIQRGAGITATEEKKQTPLMGACANGHLDLVELLLQNRAGVDALNIDGMNAAYAAACNGHLKVLQKLLSRGADIFNKSKTGWLPIHAASLNGHHETVDLLIENGSDIMVNNADGNAADGNTPLELATIKHHVDVVNVLLKHGVDIDAKDSFGQTSLFIASCEGDTKLTKLLLDNYVDVSIKDNEGRTPLFCASCNGHLEIVGLLLEYGADMTPNNKGQTPAYMASVNGRINVLRLLIKSGADISAQAVWRHTLPFDAEMAATNVSDSISSTIKILEAAMGNYKIIQDDTELGETFHCAGRGLSLILEVLSTASAQIHIGVAQVAQVAESSLNSCNTTATLFEAAFKEISQAPANARRDTYLAYIKMQGKGSLVEALVAGIMEHVSIVAEYCVIEGIMQEQLAVLQHAIDTLADMESSVPIKQKEAIHCSNHIIPNYSFSNCNFSSHNFSNHSNGRQNIATDKAVQFVGAGFEGPVNFNKV